MQRIGLKERKLKKVLGTLFIFAMAVGLMHMFVYAATFSKIQISDSSFYPSGCLKSLTVTVQATGSYATAYGKIAIHSSETQYGWQVGKRYIHSDNCTQWPDSINDSSMITISNDDFLWTDCNEHKVTVVFADSVIPCNQAGTYYVYLWTRAQSFGVYPDAQFNNITVSEDGVIMFGDQEVTTSPHDNSSGKTKTSGQNATCTSAGLKDYYRCSHCNKYFSDESCENEITDLATWIQTERKIDALNHNWVYSAEQATLKATCSRDSSHVANLTLVASSPTYSECVEGIEDFNGLTGLEIAADSDYIKFFKTKKSGAVTGGTEISATDNPTDGYYYATLTVEGQTAVKAFVVGNPKEATSEKPTASTDEANETTDEPSNAEESKEESEVLPDNASSLNEIEEPVIKKSNAKKANDGNKTTEDGTTNLEQTDDYDNETETVTAEEVISYKVYDALVDWPKLSIESIRCDRPDYQNLCTVYVDEQKVDAKYYTISGSETVVTFENDYLKTLAVGEHIVELEYTDGAIYKGKLIIIEDNGSKMTNASDETINTNELEKIDKHAIWPVVLVIFFLVIAIIFFLILKKKKNEDR